MPSAERILGNRYLVRYGMCYDCGYPQNEHDNGCPIPASSQKNPDTFDFESSLVAFMEGRLPKWRLYSSINRLWWVAFTAGTIYHNLWEIIGGDDWEEAWSSKSTERLKEKLLSFKLSGKLP